MIKVSIHQAKTNLSKLIQLALEGQEVVIAKGADPLVVLKVLEQARPRRKAGFAKKLIKKIADDFDAEIVDFKDYKK